MSLLLLLLAMQGADTQTDPPPLKVKPVQAKPVQVTSPSPTTATPGVTYVPTTKVDTAPTARPGVTYVPAAKLQPMAEARAAANTEAQPTEGASPFTNLSEKARARLAEEKQADTQRRAALREEMAAAQDLIAKALTSKPLDMNLLKTALEHRDQVMAGARSKVTASVMDLLGDVPAEERLTVAKALIEGDSGSQRSAPEQKPKPTPVGR